MLLKVGMDVPFYFSGIDESCSVGFAKKARLVLNAQVYQKNGRMSIVSEIGFRSVQHSVIMIRSENSRNLEIHLED